MNLSMKSAVAILFSDQYANKKAIGCNNLLHCMYRFAHPLSKLLYFARVKPNVITLMSCGAAIAAAYSIACLTNKLPFIIFWCLSILLDFCDGTVARMSGNVTRTAFRVDHMSDIAKISIIIIATGWHYESQEIWVLACFSTFIFLYSMLTQHDLNFALEVKNSKNKSKQNSLSINSKSWKGEFKRFSVIVLDYLRIKSYIKIFMAVTMTLNGHTLLLFIALVFNENTAKICFCYFILLCGMKTVSNIKYLLSLPKPSL